MNYMLQSKAFDQWLEHHYLPAASQLLWFRLAGLFNRCGWPEWVSVDNLRLMAMIQCKREATFIETRNLLIENGLIDYIKGRKGCPGQYKMTELTFTGEVQTVTIPKLRRSTNSNQSVAQTVDIYKLNQTKPNSVSPDGDTARARAKTASFSPPSVDDVSAYCAERNNTVDAESFVDYYATRGWMVGKNRMKDWKAAVRTWERNAHQRYANASPAKPAQSDNVFADMARELRGEGR